MEYDLIMSLFERDLSAGRTPGEALNALLLATRSRAAGLWKLEGEILRQVGFCAVEEMANEVSSTFSSATESVSLNQSGLGIVKAILTGCPTLARVDGVTSGLGASASWLARFECRASLAIPTANQIGVNGVLAVSSAEEPAPDDDVWLLMSRLAESLGVCL